MDIKLPLLLAGALLFSGCTLFKHKPETADLGQNDEASVKLAEAATSVSHSLSELSAIRQAMTPPSAYKNLADPATFNMPMLVNIDWSGPIEPFLRQIANMSGYRLRVLGRHPAVPIIVSVSTRNTPLAYVVRDVDFQAGRRAKVMVYPSVRILELRYAGS